MPALPISGKQMEMLNAFRAFVRTHGRTPSVRELTRLVGKSVATVHQHLCALEEQGLLVKDGSAHGWQLAPDTAPEPHMAPVESHSSNADLTTVVIRGTIAAGRPIDAFESNDDVLTLPRDLVGEDAFALRVKGDSMIDDHILDGDLVLIRPQAQVENGEIAVALLEDATATLKRIYREPKLKKIRLQPANDAMEPILVDKVTIQGKVIGVFRPLSRSHRSR